MVPYVEASVELMSDRIEIHEFGSRRDLRVRIPVPSLGRSVYLLYGCSPHEVGDLIPRNGLIVSLMLFEDRNQKSLGVVEVCLAKL